MKRSLTLPASFLLALAAARGAEQGMWLRFDNGDALSGRMTGLAETSISWESNLFDQPQRFKTDRLREVEIPPGAEFNLPEGNHIANVTLTNGDELRGCLTRVTDTEIGLLTSYAGELAFRRDMVETLKIEDRPDPIYIGPAGLDGWVQSIDKGWSYESAALVCRRSSSIGRDIGRHDRIRINFDISWRENARFRLFLHADSENPEEMTNGYELVCQSQYAYMRKRTATDWSTVGSTGGIREFTDRDKIRFEILQDLTTGRIRLMVDGRVIDDWQEAAPAADKMGSFIHFSADRSDDTRISRIMITGWDGLIDGEWNGDGGGNPAIQLRGFGFDEPEEPKPAAEPEEEPGIRLRNGDRVQGEIVEILDGMVKLKTPFNEFQLPVSRLRDFALRTAEQAADPELRWEPIRRNGDIRAHFSDGGHVTFQLSGLEDGKLIGRSQTFGDGAFDIGAFSKLEFNIYPVGLPGN